MEKNDIKLIVSDIDGTLINDKEEMPENFLKVMEELEKRNIVFVAASGRSIPSIKNKLQYESDNLYYISDNGAILKHQDDIFFQNSFTQTELEEAIKIFRKCDEVSIIASTAETNYAELNPEHTEDFLKEFMVNYKLVDDITNCDGDFVKLTMRSDHKTTENYNRPEVRELAKKHHLVRAGIPWIDLMKADTNKGSALEVLLEHLNIAKENTIGFGDFPNDIHMLEVVGKSYAMCDGHDSVIDMADEVIASNNNNSVMKKIIELLELDI